MTASPAPERPTFTPSAELFPFTSRWFASSVGRVHYVDQGQGRPILFLHGNPTWSFLYRGIITRLQDRFRCVAVDYPGFGLSDRPSGYGYTPAEHMQVVGELVDHLGLEDLIIMGQDWGGPIGVALATTIPERVSGLVLGNTWFWPVDLPATRIFSRVMSSPPLQWAILQRNFFVERLIPAGAARRLTSAEMDHYRGVQPSPQARVGVAEFPRQLLAARPWLAKLAAQAPALLWAKPVLLVWGMRDVAFPPKATLPRMRATFSDVVLVELPMARHFIQEDAPEEIGRAVLERFG
ncbi:alpha/beta fold hydrolase [Streptomyces sp. NPDC001795]|uniref:alpha/beta fold hydrolase n=1 Tax=Streptomyces sp. NPDC001795 TaxID=3154525 RepID=UPI003318D817